MNKELAKEVGLFRFISRKLLWRVAPPKSFALPTGVNFLTPSEKFFASDVFLTRGNVDWSSEYIWAAYLSNQDQKGDFLDVGAHIGYYSCLLSPFVNNIYAFEPDQRNMAYLKNALSCIDKATIIAKAVSNFDGEVALSDSEESCLSHIDPNKKDGPKVPVTTLDTIVAENNLSPSAIKMDIEGFEIDALEGACQTTATHSPVFLIEYGQEANRPNTWEKLDTFLKSVGYSLFAVSRTEEESSGFQYRFQEHSALEMDKLSTKMHFLVPPQKKQWFEDFGKKHSPWDINFLKPKAIHSLLAEYKCLTRKTVTSPLFPAATQQIEHS